MPLADAGSAPIMGEHEVDVVVIGMGPGGEHAAEELARAGLVVAGVEDSLVGGECPYWGCVPSKMMIRAGNLLAEGRRIPGMAGTSAVAPDWAPVAERIRAEATDDWDDAVAADRVTGLGGRLFRGRGRIIGPGRVGVGDEVIRARRGIVINTGSAPQIPPVPGLAGTPYWTNHHAIETKRVPRSLIVLGGGGIACELAQVFARFGAAVTVVEAGGRLLFKEEPEAGELLAGVFRREGVDVRTGVAAEHVAHDGSGCFTVALADGAELGAEALLVATGRRSDLAAIGTGAVGIDEGQDFVPVDEHMRAAPGVWAIGDIAGHGPFTHMSMYQAAIAVADILGRDHHGAEYHAVPRVTFTDPEIGSVGLTEAKATEQGLTVRSGLIQVPETTRGWIHMAGNDGFIKLVEDAKRSVLVGATSAGPWGGEVLGLLTLAVHAEVPTQRLREMIYAYPTFHRGIEDALRAL
jgi:pyruvate/2-oxoglutarate dehydrogenase complex dihydrolipoamide dehydrogenase (E3) component